MHSAVIFFLFSTFVVSSLGCSAQTNSYATFETSTVGKKRRSVNEVIVTLVTNKRYDEKTKKQNHERLNKFQDQEGFYIDYSEIQETIKQQSGKFAVEYKTTEECDQVKNFVRGAKSTSHEISYILLACGNQPLQII